jgi:hypothetical protein
MKTFFTRLFVHFEAISHPASGWFTKSTTTEKTTRGSKRKKAQTPSPDSYQVRGRFSKKANTTRRTMAP